jgi:predicted HTH domain antitoxin
MQRVKFDGGLMTHEITLTIPGSLVQEMKLPPDTAKEELLNELAICLYRRKILTWTQVCWLSGLERDQFKDLL